ncbi:hypothetical protein BWQ96_02954 [Gracilariopsis chorda]|uniref:Uncharacterized protein n=1 Tax=Gracilariopsis chorda TaxID=448386 RepID=A0A2V3IYJ7_9FLOR|nr:hypothetical protein BWQ96_02954 [Gracilariopsis chorda]|eukprot:PXF47179.1 hypothetical protein BWQ96_02954 [Gracilariopsis chorda]
MVVTDTVPADISLSPQDAQVASAISAWLSALNLVDADLSFEYATRQCVALCRVFALFAPHLLAERDFFEPTSSAEANLSRHRRYNTRRLAKSLVRYFHICPPDPRTPLTDAPTPRPLIQLRQQAKDTVLSLSEAARTEDVEPLHLMLSLAEVVLSAAVHSEQRETFIKAVLTLSQDHQDALAASICRTTVENAKDTRVLGQISVNDENLSTSRPSSQPNKKSNSLDAQSSPLSAPRGIPLADYKALAAERDNLRRKLAACEFERNKAVELSQGLKSNLEEASDKVRLLESKQEQAQTELVTKAKALNDAKSALRGAHVAAEEVDILRARAASAEQLEASLKRASKRLEEVADMRKMNKDLEAQISALRENEERITKHTEYLESQLTYSNNRSTQFAKLTESLTADIEKKEDEIKTLKSDNSSLKAAVEAANQQLATFLMQSAHTASRDTAMNKPSEDASASVKHPANANIVEQVLPASVHMSEELIKERACDILSQQIGARMGWEDIVECIDGVMDALKDLDAMESDDPSVRSASDIGLERRPSSVAVVHKPRPVSRGSLQSIDTNASYVGSEAESRMSLLPEFTVMDYQERAQKGYDGDEFDYAANHTNVEEIPLDREVPPLMPSSCGKPTISPTTNSNPTSFSTSDASSDPEPADETVNATVPAAFSATVMHATDPSSCERKSSGVGSVKRSPNQPHSPFLAEDIMHSGRQTVQLQYGSRQIRAVRHSSLAQLSTAKRASSLSMSRRSGISSSESRSDTTRTLVLQARNELLSLQNTLDLMRTERQSSRSVGSLVHQLDITRKQLNEAHAKLLESNAECNSLRSEMDLLLKEVDMLSAYKEHKEEEEAKVLEEKERMIEHLRSNLKVREEELSNAKKELKAAAEKVRALEHSRKTLEDSLRAAKVVERAQEVEIARLNAKLETSEGVVAKLQDVMKRADGLQKEISKERENRLNGIAEAVKREQRIAEEARQEARRVAKNHSTMLEDVRASAIAAARGSMKGNQDRTPRKGTRFAGFWRRLLHLDRFNNDVSTSPTAASDAAEKDGQAGRNVRSKRL